MGNPFDLLLDPHESSTVPQFSWAKVDSANSSHITIKLDGSDALVPVPLNSVLIDPTAAVAGTRVLILHHDTRLYIVSTPGGDSGGGGIPAGAMTPWTSNIPPAGWLICDGQAVSRTTYADLFAIIGTTYGAGNGSTTFNVPDLRGRVPVGLNATDPEFDALGKKSGRKNTNHVSFAPPLNSGKFQDPGAAYIASARADMDAYLTSGESSTLERFYAVRNVGGTIGTDGASGTEVVHFRYTAPNIQPSFTANWIIKGMGGIGSLTPTVEAALVNRTAILEQKVGDNVGMRRIKPTSVAVSGGGVTVDQDGTVEITTSGTKALSLNGIFQVGKSYKISYLFNTSGAENIAYRMRKGSADYTVAGYVLQGIYVSGGWPGSIAGVSGYGAVGTSGLLSVNGQVMAYGELQLFISKIGAVYITGQGVSRSGQTSTQWRHTLDVASGADTDGITFSVNVPVLNVGSYVKVWELL